MNDIIGFREKTKWEICNMRSRLFDITLTKTRLFRNIRFGGCLK